MPQEFYACEVNLNAHTRLLASTAARGWLSLPLMVFFVLSALGCTGEGPPPPENRGAIEGVAKWYQLYHSSTGKPPNNEEEFVAFIEKELQQRGQTLDREKLLTSPRDGQKFVVRYGEPLSNNQENNWVVREQEGYDGKVLIANEFGSGREVDEAELKSLWGPGG